MDKIVEWFRTYKTLEGKGLNEFREDGKIYNRQETLRIIFECSKEYREMMEVKRLSKQKYGYWLGGEDGAADTP